MRTLVETGVLVGEPGAYRLGQALPTIQVPATVQAVLAARIDRLPPEEKCLLQTAAVIGPEWQYPCCRPLPSYPRRPCPEALPCPDGPLPLRDAPFPGDEYTFKHALTHEVAYGSALPGAPMRAPCPHCRGPRGALSEAGWASRANAWRTMPCGRGLGQSPGILLAGGGEGPGAVGPPRGRGVFRASPQGPHLISQRSVRHACRPSTSASPCAQRSCHRATLSVSWRLPARG